MGIRSSRREFLAAAATAGLAALPWPGLAADPPRAVRRGLVILVEFPGTQLRVDTAYVGGRFRDLDRYVREMSYGATGVENHLSGWHRMPDPLERYTISPINLQVDKSRVVKLIQDAIDAADSGNDFSRHDHVVVFLRARFTDYGMVGLCGYPGMLGWQQAVPFKTRSGQPVPGGVAIFTVSAHLGTLFHDCAHVWGGVRDGKRVVPCLYDHDLQIQYPTIDRGWANALINMGFWDPMSCHAYKRELPPPGISSWTRLRLGWMPPGKVRAIGPEEASAEVLLGPLEDAAAETSVIRVPFAPDRFLLVENRQPIGGFDPHLPGHGVLVMKADDRIAECRFGRAPVRLIDADPGRRFLTGAAFDLPDRAVCDDAESGVRITLLDKAGPSYRIRVERRG